MSIPDMFQKEQHVRRERAYLVVGHLEFLLQARDPRVPNVRPILEVRGTRARRG